MGFLTASFSFFCSSSSFSYNYNHIIRIYLFLISYHFFSSSQPLIGALFGVSHSLRTAEGAGITSVEIQSRCSHHRCLSAWLALRQIHVSQHSGAGGEETLYPFLSFCIHFLPFAGSGTWSAIAATTSRWPWCSLALVD